MLSDNCAGSQCRAAHSPTRQRVPGGKFDGTTTYGTNFHAHPIEVRPAAMAAPQRPTVPFDGTSTYSHEFVPKAIAPRAPPAPMPACAPAPPLDAATTYGDTFHQHQLPERPKHAPPAARPHVPFDATTTNRDMYVQHAIEPRQPPPMARVEKAHVPFDGTTTNNVSVTPLSVYTCSYQGVIVLKDVICFTVLCAFCLCMAELVSGLLRTVEHALSADMGRPIKARVVVHVICNSEGVNVQDQFKQWPIEPRVAAIPPPMRPHVPFNGTTTNQEAFRGWQLPPAFPGIGLELVGDRMHTLVPRGARLPYTGRHVFSTVNDNQTELCILIYAGDSKDASKNELLGQFDMSGMPAGPAQGAQIEVLLSLFRAHWPHLQDVPLPLTSSWHMSCCFQNPGCFHVGHVAEMPDKLLHWTT